MGFILHFVQWLNPGKWNFYSVAGGANVNDAIGCNGMPPLFLAAQEGCEEMCKCFIANGADVNAACSTEACTPLWMLKPMSKFVTIAAAPHS